MQVVNVAETAQYVTGMQKGMLPLDADKPGMNAMQSCRSITSQRRKPQCRIAYEHRVMHIAFLLHSLLVPTVMLQHQ
jgi:hypothetical protein